MRIIDGFVLRSVSGQTIVVGEGVDHLYFNKLLVLNDSAAFLWRSVVGREFDFTTLTQLLVAEYKIDQERAMVDASAMVLQWIELGVVQE